jgi:hypothetical protein
LQCTVPLDGSPSHQPVAPTPSSSPPSTSASALARSCHSRISSSSTTIHHESSARRQAAFALVRIHPGGAAHNAQDWLLRPHRVYLRPRAAFFTHQGHEVVRDSCPDLAAYRQAGRITSTIVDVVRKSPRGSTSWPPSPLLPRGTHSACLLWRSTFPFLHRPQSPELILSPSLPLFLGGLGGAFTPSDWRLSRFSTSLRELGCIFL